MTGEKSVLQSTQALLLRVPDAYTTKPLGLPPFVAALVLWRERRFSFGDLKMSEKQPDALRLATILGNEFDTYTDTWSAKEAAAELRRLHGVNFELLETLRNISEFSTDAGAIACARAAIAYATGE